MVDDALRVLKALELNWSATHDEVWNRSPYHVEGLQPQATATVLDGLREAERGPDAHPLGVVITGPAGAGKTHLLGWSRERVQSDGGYFFLVALQDEKDFWRSVASSMAIGLMRDSGAGTTQLAAFLDRLAGRAMLQDRGVRDAVLGRAPLSPAAVQAFVSAVRRLSPMVGMQAQDTLRALVLLNSGDYRQLDIGQYYLSSSDETDVDERRQWGFQQRSKPELQIVRELSRLLALTGPSVIAVDQLDSLMWRAGLPGTPTELDAALAEVAVGLMELRESTPRTLTLLACVAHSWEVIRDRSMRSIADRFRQPVVLRTIPSAEIALAMVAKRFAPLFEEIGFQPLYPTWPIRPAAFTAAVDYTPRGLLQRIDAHIRHCIATERVIELDRLDAEPPAPVVAAVPQPTEELSGLDARFSELKASAEIGAATNPETEDDAMPGLLSAGLAAWILERGDQATAYRQDPPFGPKPPLHARLRWTVNAETETEEHWAFRAIAATHGNTVRGRLRAAMNATGRGTGRTLIVLRGRPWPPNAPTALQLVQALRDDGGSARPIHAEDLSTFAALQQMLADRDSNLSAWLRSRQPATRTEIFRATLTRALPPAAGSVIGGAVTPTAGAVLGEVTPAVIGPAGGGPAAAVGPARAAAGEAAAQRQVRAADDPTRLTIGIRMDTREPLTVGLDVLRRHTVVFGGAGSGKTVVLRRIIEDCALRGVSSIVFDPNNDLARLGERWPEPPAGWVDGDADRAEEYLASTDVVVWTPGLQGGRPLSFQPLPDFDSVRSDPDDWQMAINVAVDSLLPKANARGARGAQAEAVLRGALDAYARDGGRSLRGFTEMLKDLPDGVSQLSDRRRIAAGLADALYAATVNDPLFGGAGEPADPGTLLAPASGKRARVSVISFVGLPAAEQKQNFANQLQMALFAWIKEHPAGDRPLSGVFVMDEAQTLAPASPQTPATNSTLALAQQARKYGLGLIFATQMPRGGLHNEISHNATTQLLGLLGSLTQINNAQDLARARNGDVSDIGRLARGEFYAATEGIPFRKVRTRNCLSRHGDPLTRDEVIKLAHTQA